MNAKIQIQSVVKETEKAMLIRFNNDSTAWLPKSQTTYSIPESFHEFVEIPMWLANKLVDSRNINRIDF